MSETRKRRRLVWIVAFIATFTGIQSGAAATGEWRALLSRADSLYRASSPDSALTTAHSALRLALDENGEVDSSVALCYHQIGNCLQKNSRASLEWYKKALHVWDSLPSANGRDVAKTLHNLANMLRNIGETTPALGYCLRAVEVKRQSTPIDYKSLANSLNLAGELYQGYGDYTKAEQFFEEALQYRKNLLPRKSRDVVFLEITLAATYAMHGRFAKAVAHYDSTVKYLDSLPDQQTKAALFCNLGVVKNFLQQYEPAKEFSHKSLELLGNCNFDTTQEKTFDLCAKVYQNLTISYRMLGQYDSAVVIQRRGLELATAVWGDNHPSVSVAKYNLANNYRQAGDWATADSLYRIVSGDYAAFYGETNVRYAQLIESMGRNMMFLDDDDSAAVLFSKAFDGRRVHFAENALALGEWDAMNFSTGLRESALLYLAANVGRACDSSSLSSLNEDLWLRYKGLVSDLVLKQHRRLHAIKSDKSEALIANYRDAVTAFSAIKLRVGLEANRTIESSMLDSLRREKEDFESRLANLAAFDVGTDTSHLTFDGIKACLPSRSTVVDFIRLKSYKFANKSVGEKYVAIVLKQSGERVLTALGATKTIDSLCLAMQDHMARIAGENHYPINEDKKQYDALAQALYHCLWEPISQFVSGSSVVFIAPDAALNLIAFGGLENASGQYLVEQIPIHYISAARDLLELNKPVPFSGGALLVGAPNFDATSKARHSAQVGARQESMAGVESASSPFSRSAEGDCRSFSNISVQSLAGSLTELSAVSSRLSSSDSIFILSADSASEVNAKSLLIGKKYAHFATHGLYVSPECEIADPAKSGLPEDNLTIPEYDLGASGLCLAGFNLHGSGPDSSESDDGILTAEEISTLDLSGLQLVVLSACETAKGALSDGEGVFGLRRSFQLAGTRTVVSSLWKVPDKATSEFMKSFYGDMKRPVWQRMREASLAQLQKLRKAGLADHPYSWAGFVAFGDWR